MAKDHFHIEWCRHLPSGTLFYSSCSIVFLVVNSSSHYYTERNHQGIGNVIPFPDERLDGIGPIRKNERLGGLLTYYYRDAA